MVCTATQARSVFPEQRNFLPPTSLDWTLILDLHAHSNNPSMTLNGKLKHPLSNPTDLYGMIKHILLFSGTSYVRVFGLDE